jgi:hypothetical protein
VLVWARENETVSARVGELKGSGEREI